MLRFLRFFNHLFGAIGSIFQSPLLLLLRLFFGIGFMIAGFGKLQDISKFSDLLLTLHIPYPEMMAWITALTEIIGGFFLAIGLLSRMVSIPLIAIMVVAYATAHVDSIHALLTDPRIFVSQAPFNFLLTALLVLAFGPGVLSVDALLDRKGRLDEQKLAK